MDMNQYISFLTQEAEAAMIAEVESGPKPGLVDRFNNGSHQDMDINMFRSSAAVLSQEFRRFMEISLRSDHDKILPLLRQPGMAAEARMYEATGGINTHKGLIFSLGLICACLVRLALKLSRPPRWQDRFVLMEHIKLNTTGLTGELTKDPTDSGPITHGIAAYRTFGMKGVRQEAEEGYPAVFFCGLPKLREFKLRFKNKDLPLLMTLLELILVTGDTNLIKRGGLEGLDFMQTSARSILDQAGTITESELLAKFKLFDETAISRNLSPGGAADHLAICIFLNNVLDQNELS